MTADDVYKIQKFRISVLMEMYKEAKGLVTYTFPQVSNIECLLKSEEFTSDQLYSALSFLFQENYINYYHAGTDRDMYVILDMSLTSKGIRLVETILTNGNVEQFANDFAPKFIKQIIIKNNVSSTIQVLDTDKE